jgi:NAD(P)-dependent dehydrogenase (short-subunit alcohol dehydrogenase family)
MKQYAQYPSLKNRSVFITGGATGIGAVMVEEFAKQGAKVCFVDIDQEAGLALEQKLTDSFPDRVQFVELDVTNLERLKSCIDETAKHHGSLDVLINNVANDQRHSPLEVSPEQWRNCLSVNLDATFFACQAAIPHMKAARRGNIINLSSINVMIGPKQMPGYVAAKSALNGLSKSLANQYGEYGIRVNLILPGWVVTDKQVNLWLTPEAEKEWQKSVALRGRLEPIQIANMALFLAADDSEMITGQQFIVDAGRT